MTGHAAKAKWLAILLLCVIVCTVCADVAWSQSLPKVTLEFGKDGDKGNSSLAIQIMFLITVLTLAPAIMIMMTSFTRLIIVFHFLKQALGTPQVPANQIVVGLALFLTFFIMQPVLSEIGESSVQPFLADKISQEQAIDKAMQPLRRFMLKQVREKDLLLFVKLAKIEHPKSKDDLPTYILIPSFIISELRIAFQLGFVVYMPLLLVDLVVSVVLMSMGMMMLPPIMISMPFKILLFVLVDGWYLVIDSVVSGF